MRKILLFLTLATLLCACEKESPKYNMDSIMSFWADDSKSTGNESYEATITRLYTAVFRQNLIVPTQAYVMELNNSRYFYMYRSRFNMDLKVGDKISFQTSAKNPYEIVVINGYVLGEGEDAQSNDSSGGLGYLFASDPIEAKIKGIFYMKVRYLTLVDMVFIVTTDDNLIYIKKSKLNIDLQPGDVIAYSVYNIIPNSVVEIKRLNRR